MKKHILIILSLVITLPVTAQDFVTERKKNVWVDLKIAQYFGLNDWSEYEYINNGFPRTSLTELRGALNFYFWKTHMGGFVDMGIGVMPSSKMTSFDLKGMPMPHNNTKYYLREMLSKEGKGKTSAHFKMTFGIFGDLPTSEKFTIMPYGGIGFMTMPDRKYEMILKEDGSNIQYNAIYGWNHKEEGESSPLGYLTGRLNFKYKLSPNSSLLLGLEYMWYFTALEFYSKFSNTFNANIEREVKTKGDKMNMLGFSIGISFK